jgi:hypothetical protein
MAPARPVHLARIAGHEDFERPGRGKSASVGMDAPFAFTHELDLDLFALDRLEDLRRRAPQGKFGAQLGDEAFERPAGAGPVPTELEGAIADEAARRPLHLHFHDVGDWAPEYGPARDHVLDIVASRGGDGDEKRYAVSVVIRVFSGGVPVSLHADGETQIDCGVGGRSVWHVARPEVLSIQENENLLRGGQFLRWREVTPTASFDLGTRDGFAAPPRWPHWIEHPGDEPAVSFEVGYWTPLAIRERKVYDMNWLLRRARLTPKPPGVDPRRDRLKQRTFDLISMATGKGGEYRGI